MIRYIDGFVVPVPKANIEAYRRLAQTCGEVWKEYGALAYIECVGDDIPDGEVTSFPLAVKATAEETVLFSWIVYESREHRDAVNDKVMADPRMKEMCAENMPFDGKRLIFGGFSELISI